MTKSALEQVITRAISDAAFRAKLHTDPDTALAGVKLSQEERSAVIGGDPQRLTALGIDQRMSKAFDIGGVGGSAASKTISPEAAGLVTSAREPFGVYTRSKLDEEMPGGVVDWKATTSQDAASTTRAAGEPFGVYTKSKLDQEMPGGVADWKAETASEPYGIESHKLDDEVPGGVVDPNAGS